MPIPPTAIPGTSDTFPGTAYYEIEMLEGTWQFHRDLDPATTLLSPKDTVKAYTDMVTRIIQPFNAPAGIPGVPNSGTTLPAEYMHHRHILEHEDNDKMRPWAMVEPGTATGVPSSRGGSN